MSTGHEPGPGLVPLNDSIWYGGGYCGLCGERGKLLVPQAVRYWDVDDGWKVGVLCVYCGPEVAERGPRPTDHASHSSGPYSAREIDALADLLGDDLDSLWADTNLD